VGGLCVLRFAWSCCVKGGGHLYDAFSFVNPRIDVGLRMMRSGSLLIWDQTTPQKLPRSVGLSFF